MKSFFGPSEKQIRAEVIRFIVTDLQPISIVEDPGFLRFVKFAFPQYQVPARSTVTLDIEKMYNQAKQSFIDKLKAVEFIAITTDGWTSKYTTDYYVAVTLHYVNPEDGQPKSNLMRMIQLNSVAHTGENIAHAIEMALNEWKLYPKIVAVVSDSAASQVKANELLNIPFLPCIAHTMQLAIRDALEDSSECKSLITKMSKISTHFKRSAPAKRVLQKIQEKMKENHSIYQNVKTR